MSDSEILEQKAKDLYTEFCGAVGSGADFLDSLWAGADEAVKDDFRAQASGATPKDRLPEKPVKKPAEKPAK